MVRGANAVLSRTRRTRRTPYAAAQRGPADTQPSAQEPAARGGSLPDVFSQSPSGQHPGAPSSRGSSRRALKNWRVRSRLFLLVIIPTVAAVILGSLRIGSSVQSALADQRIAQLASLNGNIIGLVQAIQTECPAPAEGPLRRRLHHFIAVGRGGDEPARGYRRRVLPANSAGCARRGCRDRRARAAANRRNQLPPFSPGRDREVHQ